MQITFNQSGSSQGRKDFANGVTDFGDSDIPYQGVDPTTGQTDASTRPYAYAPVVAGGTAFTYHLTAGGHLVTNLRLSGETITKIFTNKITNWADPAITKENGGHALPSETIKPVVRSDGSGATAQFTLWMDKQYPSLWRPFNGGKAGLTSIFPRQGNQIAVAQDAGRDEHDQGLRRRGRDRLHRVLLPAAGPLPGRVRREPVGLLRPAHAVQRRGRAHPGQHRRLQQERHVQPERRPGEQLPDPEPRPGLHLQGPADLPALVVLLHDHPGQQDRPADDRAEAADARGLPQLLAVHRTAPGRPVRLLAAAAQPREGRLRPAREARPGRAGRRRGGRARQEPVGQPGHLQQPDVRQGRPGGQPPGPGRADAAGVPEGDERAVRRRHRGARHQRQRPRAATHSTGTTARPAPRRTAPRPTAAPCRTAPRPRPAGAPR